MYGFVDTVPGSGTGSTSLMSIRTIFNGIDLDQELTDETGSFTTLTVNGRNNTNSRINSFSVPGMDGAHEEGNTLDAKTINVRFRITDKTNEGFRERLNRLNALLSGSKQVLEFTDEDAVFYATVSSIDMPDEESNDLIGNIFFYCSDPYKYGPELEAVFPEDAVTVTNNGTAPAKPVFELEVNESTTFAMVSNGEEYLMMGRPVEEGEDTAIEPLTTVTDKKLNTFVGWNDIAGGFVFNDPLAEGIVAGNFSIGNGQWYVSNWGTNPNGWHGPAKRTSLGEALQDFQVDYYISNLNFVGQMGKNVLMLTDANNNIIASMGAIDRTLAVGYYGRVQFYLGGEKRIFDFRGFNNQQVLLRLKREGNLFTATAYQLDDNGNTTASRTETFTDTLLEYQQPITQATIYLASYKQYQATRMYANRIIASKVNDVTADKVPIIAHPGDKIEMDFATRALRINGELRNDLISMGSQFFKLEPGVNNIVIAPEESFNTTIRYREPFK